MHYSYLVLALLCSGHRLENKRDRQRADDIV
eukprot:COSAG06_NODE_21741_length_747_cov_0.870370_1_plen_30_part_10